MRGNCHLLHKSHRTQLWTISYLQFANVFGLWEVVMNLEVTEKVKVEIKMDMQGKVKGESADEETPVQFVCVCVSTNI